jgi:hypothetical protein
LARFTVSKREAQNIAVNSLPGVDWVIPKKEGCAVLGNAIEAPLRISRSRSPL